MRGPLDQRIGGEGSDRQVPASQISRSVASNFFGDTVESTMQPEGLDISEHTVTCKTETSCSLLNALSTSLPVPSVNKASSGLPSSCERTSHAEPSSLPAQSSHRRSLPTALGRSMMVPFPPTPPSHMGSNPLRRRNRNGSTILPAASDIPTARIHALVVDDDQLTRKLMERMLQVRFCTCRYIQA